jgi:hypothetical protein
MLHEIATILIVPVGFLFEGLSPKFHDVAVTPDDRQRAAYSETPRRSASSTRSHSSHRGCGRRPARRNAGAGRCVRTIPIRGGEGVDEQPFGLHYRRAGRPVRQTRAALTSILDRVRRVLDDDPTTQGIVFHSVRSGEAEEIAPTDALRVTLRTSAPHAALNSGVVSCDAG